MQSAGRESFDFGGYTLDLTRGCLRNAAGEIELRPKSFELLRYLIENAGRLISKDELVKAVWPNVIVGDDSLAQCVSDLRHALNDSERRIIKTVPRRGYLFAAPVSFGSRRAAAPALSASFEEADNECPWRRAFTPEPAFSSQLGHIKRSQVAPIDGFTTLVDGLYEAGLDVQRWPDALAQLNAAVGANVADLKLSDFTRGRFTMVAVGMDPAAVEAYKNYYGRIDPILSAVEKMSVGTLLTDRDVVSKAWLTRTEFYNDWARPQDIHDCAVLTAFRDQARTGMLCLAAPERAAALDAPSLELLWSLMPHLRRAMQVTMKTADLDALRGAGLEALDYLSEAVVLVTSDARVLFANRAAETMLARCDGIEIDASRLCAANSTRTSALHGLIARCARREDAARAGGSLRLERPSRRRPLSVTVVPIRRETAWSLITHVVAAVFLTNPERDADLSESGLRRRYAMTRTEAMLAGLIAKGSSVEASARALGIEPSTAHTYLRRVFDKTGTRRAAELAQLLDQIG